jgi:xylulokinase
MDPGSKACFWGLTLCHHSGHMVRAVMEGVVFSLREGFDLILGLGVLVERVIAQGRNEPPPLAAVNGGCL